VVDLAILDALRTNASAANPPTITSVDLFERSFIGVPPGDPNRLDPIDHEETRQ
jgi:hypothetical protein